MINRGIIGIMLTAGILLYFAIVSSIMSVETNPDNPANQLVQEALGQLELKTASQYISPYEKLQEEREKRAQAQGCYTKLQPELAECLLIETKKLLGELRHNRTQQQQEQEQQEAHGQAFPDSVLSGIDTKLPTNEKSFEENMDDYCELVLKSRVGKDITSCFLRFNTNDTLDLTQDESKFNFTAPEPEPEPEYQNQNQNQNQTEAVDLTDTPTLTRELNKLLGTAN